MSFKKASEIVYGDHCKFIPADKLFHRVMEIIPNTDGTTSFFWDKGWGEHIASPDDLVEVEE